MDVLASIFQSKGLCYLAICSVGKVSVFSLQIPLEHSCYVSKQLQYVMGKILDSARRCTDTGPGCSVLRVYRPAAACAV